MPWALRRAYSCLEQLENGSQQGPEPSRKMGRQSMSHGEKSLEMRQVRHSRADHMQRSETKGMACHMPMVEVDDIRWGAEGGCLPQESPTSS